MPPLTVATRGILSATTNNDVARFIFTAPRFIKPEGEPSMVVGRVCPPGTRPYTEDDGRTVIVPFKNGPKCYACRNETGGVTLMLADEY